MEKKNLLNYAAKNIFSTICLVLLAVLMAYLMYGDVSRMNNATTEYDYWQNLCYLIDNIARTYFFCIYMTLAYLIYINKQYSRWCIWLYYVIGVSCLVYMGIAGYVLEFGVRNSLEGESTKHIIKLARTLFQGPVFCMVICYFVVPKFIKDTMKLKEEQDLTI